MENFLSTSVQSEQANQPLQVVVSDQDPIKNSDILMRSGEGESAVEIILAISVLIGAIAGLIKVLVPVMQQSGNKSK